MDAGEAVLVLPSTSGHIQSNANAIIAMIAVCKPQAHARFATVASNTALRRVCVITHLGAA